MNDQRKLFVEKYFETFNGYQSAIYAGYSEKTAASQASQLLDDPEISEYLNKLRSLQSERTFVNADKVQAEIARLAFSDLRDYYDENGFLKLPHQLTDDAAAALAGIEIEENFGVCDGERQKIGETKKIKLYDKLTALDKLARRLGMFEKDNNQLRPVLPKVMSINIVAPQAQ